MKGCLLIHGYTGAPFEVLPLANYLEQHGFITLCPTLHGHGGSHGDLRKSSYLQWLNSAEDAYVKLSQTCDEIAIVGFSMGGLLTFHLLQNFPAKCVVSIGTPIYCFDIKNLFSDIIYRVHIKDYVRVIQYIRGCFTPMTATLNFKKILWHSKPLIDQVDTPILVVQGKKDPIVKYKSAQYIYDHVKTQNKDIKFYDDIFHRIHQGMETEKVYRDIHTFIHQHMYSS